MAGYRTWLTQHGRVVNRGAKAISIWAGYDLARHGDDEKDDAARVTAFRLVPVFRYEDTTPLEHANRPRS